MAESTVRRTLLLLGGNEWRHGSEAADSWWLARASRPEVTVVTSAAQDIPDTQVNWAAAYFRELGGTVEGCQIQTRAGASDPRHLGQLADAAAIYLCGGDPAAAQEVLFETPAAEALRSAYRAGVPVAGSSAGAMILGTECLIPGQDFALRPGLGLFAAIVVPHWSGASRRWAEAASRLAREHEVVALDESTGLCWDGGDWAVRGPGRAVLVTGTGEVAVGEGRPSPPVE
ncbi:MAG TPA: Type 1 glutamine amidotransferase-like domain-containing protein [Candidatus Dormibacteraeota bacterium]|nr:Type 1 glutamine amidotransferase-like domain-containing protein [Candidatus Dormibacteraeota bacterium]